MYLYIEENEEMYHTEQTLAELKYMYHTFSVVTLHIFRVRVAGPTRGNTGN